MADTKVISLAEIEKHNSTESCYMSIHGKVYDVTKFLVEHPGGEEVMMDYAGKEATEAFEDVGHSQDARDMLTEYEVGTLPEDDLAKIKETQTNTAPSAPGSGSDGSLMYILIAALTVAAAVAYKFFQ